MIKKSLIIILLLSVLTAASISEEAPFTLIYWVRGTVADSTAGSANGRLIYFANSRAWDIIGESGASGKANHFLINAGDARIPLEVGQSYALFTKNINGLGAGPYYVTITGKGIENVPELKIRVGGGFSDIPIVAAKTEVAPEAEIWIDNHVYNKDLVAKGENFIVSPNPNIEVKFSISEPYSLSSNYSDYNIVVDPGKAGTQSLSIGPKNLAAKVMAAGAAGESRLQNLSIQNPQLPRALSEGIHTLMIAAKSSGSLGNAASSTRIITVEVMGGPLRVVGTPLTYPSPFMISRDKNVIIQYQLSADADIDVYLIGVDGIRIKKFTFDAGEPGGNAGLNKVSWDGRRDQGGYAGYAIYVGTIIARNDGKLLGKFMLTIADKR